MSGYLVSASGLTSRISERFVEGHMSDRPGLCAADVSRLSVCYDCFSAKHPFDVAPSMSSATLQRTVWSQVCLWAIFSASGVSSWFRERDVAGKMLGNHGTLLKSVCC